ncbi:FAD-dependent monooxygenase [Streptomyces sp. NPDC097640]|uniref:FAD-dependent monooxygenase n=1 Tax=Streptomyces sp. NPDC097640 TaxID=3157229 RepID=UPI00332C5818
MSTEILVAGGGIGGITTALACARRGIRVTVLERHSEFGEVGAGLQIGPNAWRVLRDLGVIDSLAGQAVMPRRWALHDITTGEEIFSLPFGTAFEQRYGAPYAVMHRGQLLTALLSACRATGLVTAIPGKEITRISQDTGSVTAHCADGSTFTADAAVAADGLRSTVRAQLLDAEPPLISEYVVYRGPGPRPDGIEDAVMLYVGDGIHYMQYPISGGTMLNRVASFKSTRGAPLSETWGTPRELTEKFAGATAGIRAAVAEMDTSKRWPLCDREPLPGWTLGRITLLGDAAHPMNQYLAQGACQALEDALALAEALSDAPGDPEAAFAAYEEARYPRTSAIQQYTRFIGDFCHFGGAAALLRDHFLSGLGIEDRYAYTDWLYGTGGGTPTRPIPPHLTPYGR